jgi:hypothetical protein
MRCVFIYLSTAHLLPTLWRAVKRQTSGGALYYCKLQQNAKFSLTGMVQYAKIVGQVG